jgi:hypothetical protein
MIHHSEVRENIIFNAATNKFDMFKDRFVKVAKEGGFPYLKKASDELIGRLYASSDLKMLEID